jgi:hypothetical protein
MRPGVFDVGLSGEVMSPTLEGSCGVDVAEVFSAVRRAWRSGDYLTEPSSELELLTDRGLVMQRPDPVR